MARQRVPLEDADSRRHRRQIATALGQVQNGQIDCSLPVTLAANADSTTVTDSRIGPTTCANMQANTANAAAEIAGGACYIPIATIGAGSLIIKHANNAQTDRTFTLNLSG